MRFRPTNLVFYSLLILSVVSCNKPLKSNHELSIVPADSMIEQDRNNPSYIYGIPVDSFELVSGHIKRNSFLSEILLSHGVSMPEIDQVLQNSKNIFDVRKMLPGKDYYLFCEKDSSKKAKYLVYEHDPAISYVFSFNDSLNITAFRKEVTSEIRYASGTINSSLWDVMMDNNLSPSLAVELANIFAWSVDFYGLQKGDNFKVIYEEKFIKDKSMGISKILAARFTSSGTSFTAIPFIQDGSETYFDAEGKSLRKAFLKAPLKFSRISSRYTTSRMHPILKIRRPHLGVDYAAPIGTPVQSIGDGRIISATFEGGSGRMVKIKHNSTYSTAYMHLSRFGAGVVPGAMVKQGDVIGYVGSSGLSTGPHLDFRFYQNGSPVDPLKVIAPPSDPVREENKIRFEKIREVSLSLLDTF